MTRRPDIQVIRGNGADSEDETLDDTEEEAPRTAAPAPERVFPHPAPRSGEAPWWETKPLVDSLDLGRIGQDGIPATDWIVSGWLDYMGVFLFGGKEGIGKTTLQAAFCLGISQGQPFLGLDPGRARGVLHLDLEQHWKQTARTFLRLANGNKGQTFPNLHIIVDPTVKLDSDAGAARLEEYIVRHDLRHGVLSVDSMPELQGDVDSNSTEAVGGVYRRLYALRDRYCLSLLLSTGVRKANGITPEVSGDNIIGTSRHKYTVSVLAVCTPHGPNSMKVVQTKNRPGDVKLSLVVNKVPEDADHPDGPFRLEVGDAAASPFTARGLCASWLQATVRGSEMPFTTAWVKQKNDEREEPFTQDVIKDTLGAALIDGWLVKPTSKSGKPKRGLYRSTLPIGDLEDESGD